VGEAWPAEPGVDANKEVEGSDLGSHAGKQAWQGPSTGTLQVEEAVEHLSHGLNQLTMSVQPGAEASSLAGSATTA
jgi:hypothetical protein